MLQWKKKAGDAVAADEILIEIETDKVVLEVPAPSAGVLSEILVADGGTVAAEQLIARIDTDGKVAERQIHQRGSQGDPQLLTFADGTVRVANSIPFDPKAAAEAKAKIRKASDRPPVGY